MSAFPAYINKPNGDPRMAVNLDGKVIQIAFKGLLFEEVHIEFIQPDEARALAALLIAAANEVEA
jgi:hypothetical protein